VRYLLPAIPNILYGGLSRRQVEQVVLLRSVAERAWKRHDGQHDGGATGFEAFFQEALLPFDAEAEEFSVQRVQDELIGQMAELFGIDYDTLSLDFTEGESRHRALVSKLAPAAPVLPPPPPLPVMPPTQTGAARNAPVPAVGNGSAPRPESRHDQEPADDKALLQSHIISPAPTTERLQSIQRLVADQLGETATPDFAHNVLQAIPVQAGGLYPISDVWYIDPGLDTPERLRSHIGQFAQEIASEVALGDAVAIGEEGIGFVCTPPSVHTPHMARAVWRLLASVSGHATLSAIDRQQLAVDLPMLLHGNPASRLSDTALVKLFRLLRLARRLVDLEAGVTYGDM